MNNRVTRKLPPDPLITPAPRTVPLSMRLARTARVAEYIAKVWALFTIVISLGSYILEQPARQEAAHIANWQIINGARGQGGSGGRIERFRT